MKPWLKAGLIGGGMQVLFTLPALGMFYLPVNSGMILALCFSCLFLLSYPLPGILGAHWLPVPRTVSQGAVAGLLAGILAGIVDGVVTLFATYLMMATGAFERYINQILPGSMGMFQGSEWSFLFSTGGVLLQTAVNLIFSIFFGAALSVAAGMAYVAITGNRSQGA